MNQPEFDGVTYSPKRDGARLRAQLERVKQIMSDGQYRTLNELSKLANGPEASVSARLRDLRKDKFGGYTVERTRVTNGLYKYRVIL